MEPIFFPTSAHFRDWLLENHDQMEEVWVGIYKIHTGLPSISGPEAIDEALCFGWVDALRKRLDEDSYMVRFAPHKKGGIWGRAKIEKLVALREAGLLHPAGLAAFDPKTEERSKKHATQRENSDLSPEFIERLKENDLAWEYYSNKLAPGYKKTTNFWVMRAKQAATREKRFQVLMESCESGQKIPLLRRTYPK